MPITRRSLLKAGLTGAFGLALPVARLAGPISRMIEAGAVSSPDVARFEVPLPVPQAIEPSSREADTDYYTITQREARVEILPGYQTTIWGYEGSFPGPTIEARSGRKVVVQMRNELPVPTVTHLHGGVTPPESDGYPLDLTLPLGFDLGKLEPHVAHATRVRADRCIEGARTHVYPNQQRAAMLWYHDHRSDFTGPQVYKGLAGLYIIRDEIEDELELPSGEREVPLMIADRIFDEDGGLYYPSVDDSLLGQPGVLPNFADGVKGDVILVNGAPWPRLEVVGGLYRLRFLNASNARIYELALDPPPETGSSFVQIGSDGGLLERPLGHDRLRMSPAERFDVLVDFGAYQPGTEVTLRNLRGTGRTAEVMRFAVMRRASEDFSPPARLAPPEENAPRPEEAVRTRDFQFTGHLFGGVSTINLRPFDPDRIDARPKLGATEIWNLRADPEHPVHIHLAHFRVLSRDGGPPSPYDAGWKDTVLVPGGNVRVLLRFDGYRGRYVFHCHNLEHEDMMMMANFEVV